MMAKSVQTKSETLSFVISEYMLLWILDSIIQEAPVADLHDAVPQAPEARRDRSAGARREARVKRASRERRIIALLNSGISVAELAAGERVTLRRMQILVRDILARRTPQPPAEYLALQVNRLNEAMIVSYAAMAGGNLKAVDRVVRIVSEMDRYHGFAASKAPPPAAQRRLPLPADRAPLALAPPEGARSDGKGAAND
jgi:hypothetical protein